MKHKNGKSNLIKIKKKSFLGDNLKKMKMKNHKLGENVLKHIDDKLLFVGV